MGKLNFLTENLNTSTKQFLSNEKIVLVYIVFNKIC